MAKYKNFAELKINDFRAIKSADINLNGITVVSGINGCGKTTMSKTIENIYSNLNEFEEKASSLIRENLYKYEDLINGMAYYLNKKTIALVNCIIINDWNNAVEIIQQFKEKANYENNSAKKIIRIIQEFLEIDSDDTGNILEIFYNNFLDCCRINQNAFENRDYSLFEKIIKLNKENVFFSEYDEPIVGEDIKRVPLPYAVKKVLYLDTPFAIDYNLKKESNLVWALKNANINQCEDCKNETINNFIKGKSVLNGSVYFDDMKERFFYETNNYTISLAVAATGVKSFAAIQMLLNNGWLTDKTLLIIDEPEAHLHPQWIVEYAKLIVMLHKELGVKFFIASHDPDMVRALRYIAEKDGVLESLNFYLGDKENEDDLQYTFKDCGNDIEPVFDSFNKSFSKFDEYVYPEIYQQ